LNMEPNSPPNSYKKRKLRIRWTEEEVAALVKGVGKFGNHKTPWSLIINDPEFEDTLKSRSNVDCKDKWRNMNKHTERNDPNANDSEPPETQAGGAGINSPPRGFQPGNEHYRRNQGWSPGFSTPRKTARDPPRKGNHPAPAAVPPLVFAILCHPSIKYVEAPKKAGKQGAGGDRDAVKAAAGPLEKLEAFVVGGSRTYDSAAAACAAMPDAFTSYIKDTFHDDIKSRFDSQLQREMGAEEASGSEAGSSSAFIINNANDETTRYEYTFPNGVFCNGKLQESVRGRVVFSILRLSVNPSAEAYP